jgi:protocatechuate 3,4-dioxygenase beta subunit
MSCEFTPRIVPSSGAIAQEPVSGDDCLTGLRSQPPMPTILAHSDAALGRVLTRREALALLGASGVALLAGARSLRAQTAGAVQPSCIARPQQTEGPFFVDEAINRSDIRSDPKTGEVKPGVPLRLAFRVSTVSGTSCAALAGAQVDVWHSDAEGRYSDVRGFGFSASTKVQQFLRGYQLTDASGRAQFLTIHPGWYGGRAVHVHFKIRTADASGRHYDFTSQLYFDDAFNARIFALEPYAGHGRRWLANADDGIFRDGGRELMLAPQPDGEGYAASFDVGLTT